MDGEFYIKDPSPQRHLWNTSAWKWPSQAADRIRIGSIVFLFEQNRQSPRAALQEMEQEMARGL